MNQSELTSLSLAQKVEVKAVEPQKPDPANKQDKLRRRGGIRFLKSGDQTPPWPPKRYTKGQKYVRLRWKIGKGQYVEVWEHRVRDGVVVNEIIHHKNRDRHDNSDINLCPCKTDAEHAKYHRQLDYGHIAELYRSGLTVRSIAAMFSTASGNISRVLKSEGVYIRFGPGKPGNRRIHVDVAPILALFATCHNVSEVARRTRISRHITERVLIEHSVIKRRHRNDAVREGFRAPDNLWNRQSLIIPKSP